MIKKGYVASHFDHVNERNDVVPFIVPLASCDTDTYTNVVTWPKCHVAPHFGYLYPRNAMVPLMTLSITWCHELYDMMLTMVSNDKKIHITPHFDHLDLRNVVVSFAMSSASHDTSTDASGITWPEVILHLILILISGQECNGAIDDSGSSMWCWCQCQWHHMTKSYVVPQFYCLTYGMQWCHWQ